jgi:hypothetical protein
MLIFPDAASADLLEHNNFYDHCQQETVQNSFLMCSNLATSGAHAAWTRDDLLLECVVLLLNYENFLY